jgi:hypothetical protein
MALPIAITISGPPAIHLSVPISSLSGKIQDKSDFESFLEYYKPVKTAPQLIQLDIIEKIKSFHSLNRNWDGYDATNPDIVVINNSIAFINSLPETVVSDINKDNLIPTPYGTVVIDFSKDKELVSVEIGEKKIGFFSEFEDGSDMKMEGVLFNQDKLPFELLGAIKKLYKEAITS